MLRAIIIEDEPDARNLLSDIINDYCPDIEVVGTSHSIKDSRTLIKSARPDLVFLDIELHDGNSFGLLDELKARPFKIVFTTAYNEFALKAFKYEAIDYLLKPYSPKDVITAVNRVRKSRYDDTIFNRIEFLINNTSKGANEILIVSTEDGIHRLPQSDIIHVEADRSYCFIHLASGEKLLVSKPLAEIERELKNDFFRCHSSHLVNIDHVKKYIKEDGGAVALSDGSQVPLARRRKQEFLEKLK